MERLHEALPSLPNGSTFDMWAGIILAIAVVLVAAAYFGGRK